MTSWENVIIYLIGRFLNPISYCLVGFLFLRSMKDEFLKTHLSQECNIKIPKLWIKQMFCSK